MQTDLLTSVLDLLGVCTSRGREGNSSGEEEVPGFHVQAPSFERPQKGFAVLRTTGGAQRRTIYGNATGRPVRPLRNSCDAKGRF